MNTTETEREAKKIISQLPGGDDMVDAIYEGVTDDVLVREFVPALNAIANRIKRNGSITPASVVSLLEAYNGARWNARQFWGVLRDRGAVM